MTGGPPGALAVDARARGAVASLQVAGRRDREVRVDWSGMNTAAARGVHAGAPGARLTVT